MDTDKHSKLLFMAKEDIKENIMPNRDGKGPYNGKGPRTGRQQGNCKPRKKG